MKTFAVLLLFIVVLLTCGCMSQTPTTTPASQPTLSASASIPDITGLWTGPTVGHSSVEGFREHNRSRYNITGQKGRVFYGSKEYLGSNGTIDYEAFSGTISSSGEISMADNISGYNFGRITGTDSMTLQYVDAGPDAKAYLVQLTRQT